MQWLSRRSSHCVFTNKWMNVSWLMRSNVLSDLIRYQIGCQAYRGSCACWNGRRSVRKEIFHNCQFFKNRLPIMYDLWKHLTNCSIKYNISNGLLTRLICRCVPFPEAPRLWWFGSLPCAFRPGGIDEMGELSRLKALPLRCNDVYGTWAKALELEDTVTLLLSVCDL